MTFKPFILVAIFLPLCAFGSAHLKSTAPIVVSAQGIAKEDTDVPFTVNILSEDALNNRHWQDASEAIVSVPGVQMLQSGALSYSALNIRGTGSLTPTSLDDNSVGVSMDGVALGMRGLGENLFDLAQIEIAKGPQGTLFGRNSSAGSIQLKSHNPEFVPDAKVLVDIGSQKLRRVEGMVNTPLGEHVALRIAAMTSGRDHDIAKRSGGALNRQQQQGVRGKLRWQPNAQAALLLTAYQNQQKGYLPLSLAMEYLNPPSYQTGALEHSGHHLSRGASLKVDYAWQKIQLQSISATEWHQNQQARAFIPLDFVDIGIKNWQMPAPIARIFGQYFANPNNNHYAQNNTWRQHSQELRLLSAPNAHWQWLAGLYVANSQNQFDYLSTRGLLTLPAPLDAAVAGTPLAQVMMGLNNDALNANIARQSDSQIRALYAESTLPIASRLKWLLGVRITSEKLDYRSFWQPSAGNQLSVLGARRYQTTLSERYATGRTGLDFAFHPNWHSYFLYSHGHISAGFADYGNTNIVGNNKEIPYASGKVKALEWGVKGASSNRRVRAQLAVFENNTANDKLAVQNPNNPFITDMRSVDSRVRGLEGAAQILLGKHLILNSNLALTRSQIRAANLPTEVAKAGNRLPLVPKISASFGSEYRQLLPFINGAEWVLGVNLNYVGKQFADAANQMPLPSYGLLSANIGIEHAHGSVYLWGKNLNQRHYLRYAGEIAMLKTQFALPGSGKSVGMSANWQF